MENVFAAEDGLQPPIAIDLQLNPTVNYATQQNDVPVVHSLRIRNVSDRYLQDVRISIETEPLFARPLEKTIALIGPQETYDLGIIDLPLSHDFLFQLTERVAGEVHVTAAAGQGSIRVSEKIVLLAYDEWSGLAEIPEILAAFVMPNHPAIEGILADASSILHRWTGDGSLSGYQSGERERVITITGAIYAAIQSTRISYVNPPASFEKSGQKIRTPDRILNNRLGTCLDLAVLAAACLEQAGLNPLICFTVHHAFAGVWLNDECFPDCTTDDVLRLRKRVELHEIHVFETTCVTSDPPGSFDYAQKAAAGRLDESDDFQCVIDIRRSRKSSIRPLPIRSGTEGGSSSASHVDLAQPDASAATIPFPIDLKNVADVTPAQESPASRLDGWKRKLLDLTMYNRLLNFRETRKTLRLLCPNPESLEDALADGELFRLYASPTDLDAAQPRDAALHRMRTGEDASAELLREELRERRLRADATETEMNRRLLEIYREARNSLEENGANTFYLALGFLKWYESPTSQQQRLAPIILIPLEIERRSVREGFSINRGDDDSSVNITLLELLRHDFDLSIPGMDPAPQDEHGINVLAIFTAFRKAVKEIDRWEVLEDVYIGHFSFTKFLMWRDLELRTDDLQKNKVVSHLINTPNEPFGSDDDLPDADTLDDVYTPSDIFCPVDADSSQLAAICAAAEEKSFVLHGPPGTGKSQTITNLIANALAVGKSVLFVSEKMAALNVVHRRLVGIDLGAFCLELHSKKSKKKDVIDQLGAALDVLTAGSNDDWRRDAGAIAQVRDGLNAYVRALHKPRKTGETLFYGLSKLMELRDVALVPLNWQIGKHVDRDILDRIEDVLHRLTVAAGEIVHPQTNVWAPVKTQEWSSAWRNEIESHLQQLSAQCDKLHAVAKEIGPVLGLGADKWSENELRALNSISRALMDSPAMPAALLTALDWNTLSASIDEWIRCGRNRDQLRDELYARYTSRILQLDLDALQKRLVEAEDSWLLPRALAQRHVRKTLQRVMVPGVEVEPDSMLLDIERAIILRDEERNLASVGDSARELLGQYWQDGEADWDAVGQLCSTTSSLRKLAAGVAGTDIERASALRECWGRLVSDGCEQLSADGAVGKLLQKYVERAQAFVIARGEVEKQLDLDASEVWGAKESPDHIGCVVGRIREWSTHFNELRSWCHWRKVRAQAVSLGLDTLINAYEQGGLSADGIRDAFYRAYYQWWVDQVTDSEAVLRSFFSKEFERKIEQFRALNKRHASLARKEIQARLALRRPKETQTTSQKSEMGVLQRERRKQRRHLPVRQLFQKIPNLLPRLKPCLLMSPISVAQYLDPAHPPFDLVVFDEASQIPVWDAVGAMARGREVVVVGDPKQLPPTSFFSRSDSSDTDDDVLVEDLESILDDCLAARLPNLHLRWHYRSRREGLIAFSNHHYYGNRLFTFPSPEQVVGVSLRPVIGTYDLSRSRTNQAEAEAIVAEIRRRLNDPELSKDSIGVVTFNISQQRLIEDMLDNVRRDDHAIETFFDSQMAPNAEPVFVKNLESVQGDERDVILFSICYGPDARGRISMNFGPINREGGERRLNVAITRARKEVIVFSTLRSEDIDLSRTRARGAADLKCFLDYARRGTAALEEQRALQDPETECELIFENQVSEMLRSRGHIVQSQVGCSGYKIDVAIEDPQHPGRFLLGIECDGANYHRAKTARDRDQLREMVLRGLGWNLHRVWSIDWWEDPETQLANIETRLKAGTDAPPGPAVPPLTLPDLSEFPAEIPARPPQPSNSNADVHRDEEYDRPAAYLPQPTDMADVHRDEEYDRPAVYPPQSTDAAEGHHYTKYEVTEQLGDRAAFYEPSSDDAIRSAIERVVACEGPISLRLAARRVAAHYGMMKAGSRIQQRISQIVSRAGINKTTSKGRVFLWGDGISPDQFRSFRRHSKDDTNRRDPDDLPPEEIANAALHILESQVSIPIDDLVSETARLFGFASTGSNVARWIRLGVKALIESGRAAEADGMVICKG